MEVEVSLSSATAADAEVYTRVRLCTCVEIYTFTRDFAAVAAVESEITGCRRGYPVSLGAYGYVAQPKQQTE